MFLRANESAEKNSSDQHTPTVNYFIAKLSGQTNLKQLYDEARQYINTHYPKAVPGSNYWCSLSKDTIPSTDLYFIRKMTFRKCLPPYTDDEINNYEAEAENHVRPLLDLAKDHITDLKQ